MLSYCEDYNIDGAIRVSVTGNRNNQSWAVFSRDGEILKRNPSGLEWMAPGLTESEINEARRVIFAMQDAPHNGDVYIRFNELPAAGRSRNFATGEGEKGISCYRAQWDIVSGCYKRVGEGLDGAAIAYLIQGAPIFLLSGDEAGTGADGEPLLHNAVKLCDLMYDKARDGYVEVI